MITKLWYVIIDCGDGSSYPRFCESKELCEIIDKFSYQPTEDIDCIEIKSDGPIKVMSMTTVCDEIQQAKKYGELEKLDALLELMGDFKL